MTKQPILTQDEWTSLLRVLEHGEVLHPTDAARLAAKIRQNDLGHKAPKAKAPKTARPARDNGMDLWNGDDCAPAGLMRRFAV